MAKVVLGKGDIILLSTEPKPNGTNHEQKGTRPWLVVSEKELNEISPFVWVVPFTSTKRSFPLVVDWNNVAPNGETKGTLLVQQLTCVDVDSRGYRLLEHVKVPDEVSNIIKAILGY